MRQFFSNPQPGTMIVLKVWDGARPEEELQYEMEVYAVEESAEALQSGTPAELRYTMRLGTLGGLVEALVGWGHRVTDPIIRYATQP